MLGIESDLSFYGQKWVYAPGIPGGLEWNDPDNPGAPGNFLQRGMSEVPVDRVVLVVIEGNAGILNAEMVRELDGSGNPTGKWKLDSGDPGHVAVANGATLVATARAIVGQLAIDEKTGLFQT